MWAMCESKHKRNKQPSGMFGVNAGHTIFCEEDCSYTHHEILLSLVASKRNETKTFDRFKDSVRKELATGWNRNSDIPDQAKYFRFPLVHWAAVYGKLYVLKWLIEQDFDVEVTNTQGETALHRLIQCQAQERAVDARLGRGRRYSLSNIIQVFSKVLNILSGKCPQLLLQYDYVQRNTPFSLCLKFLLENMGTCQRLVQYHQALFKVLCERLTNLVKQERLSKAFVRQGFSLKDLNGNTIWHIAATACLSESVLSSLNLILKVIEGFDLRVSNKNYETPIMVALKNSNHEFASLIEAYKFTSCTVPVVKLEMLSDLEREECICKHSKDPSHLHVEQESINVSKNCDNNNGLCLNSCDTDVSVTQNASLDQDDESLTEQPINASLVEQEKIVLTPSHETDDYRNASRTPNSKVEVDSTSQSGSEIDSLTTSQGNCELGSLNGLYDQEEIVVEKQIDLCLSVTQSTENSDVAAIDGAACSYLHTDHCVSENQETALEDSSHTSHTSNILAEALKSADIGESEDFLQHSGSKTMGQNMELPTPPDSSTSPDLPNQTLTEPCTPPPIETSSSRGVSVTPVLLIKLLSEPDVAEKFQSLLKDVITGDTEKVDSTQSTLAELKASRSNLGCEITNSEEVLETISARKETLNKEIRRLQEELSDLETSEKSTKDKLFQFREQEANVARQIEACEATCNRLKRRLSDCAGALFDLSPKVQKRC